MAAQAPELNAVQVRLRNAVYLYPMQRRVAELTNFMAECNLKDLQIFFPFLVENIFGVNPSYGNGWNLLRTSRRNNICDFEALFRFLHPFGPFFEIVYKLLGDVYLKYEYPIHFLSFNLRQVIMEGSVPQFCVDKLHIDPNLREPTALLLNAFEFYLFHFTYHLINSWQSRIDPGFHGCHETVYLHLSDQYLQHFLPIETSVVLPIVPIHQTMQLPRSPPPPQTQPQKTPKLFKNSVVKTAILSPAAVSQPHAETWRSEAFVQIIINFWLSVPGESINSNPFVKMKIQDIRSAEDILPKEDHLRVVRNMVKHIHYFVNNIHNDGSAMDELRKGLNSLCRRALYLFLRRHIYHWPLDSSFLLILETYLSYIQPWRYIKYNTRATGESNYIDNKWFNFIVENFPAYTVIIREIIPRFSRMDMTSPKHAHMLFRLTKVLSQPNLATILKDIEEHLDNSNTPNHDTTQPGSPKSPCSPGTPGTPSSPSSPGHSHSLSFPLFHRLNEVIKQEIQELESPNFQYKALFGEEFHRQVFEFVLSLQQALLLVKYLLNSALMQRRMRKTNVFQWIKDLFVHSSTGDDYTVDERQKTVTYLEHSITFLSQIFDLPPLQLPTENKNDVSGSSVNSSSSQQQYGTVEPKFINPKDWQKRSKLIRYEANPDLEPIRSTEVTYLVRLLYQLSTSINEKYKIQLQEAWERTDYWGNVARQLLSPPCKYYSFDKSTPGNFAPRVPNQLPPRISLRAFASHQTLSYIILSGVLAFLYGYPIVPFYICVFLLFVLLIFVKALIERYLSRRRNYANSPHPEPAHFVPLDVSFTD